MRTPSRAFGRFAAAASLAAGVAALPNAGGVASAAVCVRATNIEAVVDDSGSMAFTDLDVLRVRGLKLLINTLSSGTFLGAVEFGGKFDPSDPTPAADTVFKPEAIGPNATAMGTALDAKILADNGGTDYNAAFAQSDTDNPNANARIFLTDGGHNVGDYANGHLTHKVPTYVVGFSPGVGATDDQARLQQIASDTVGHFYPLSDSSDLQAVMNQIGAELTCETPPQQFNDTLAQGASKAHTIPIGANTKSIRIALTWSSPLDSFQLAGLRLVRGGKTLAVGARKRKLKVKTTTSQTFAIYRISRLRKGQLRFKVRAVAVGSGAPSVKLTTQVSRGRG